VTRKRANVCAKPERQVQGAKKTVLMAHGELIAKTNASVIMQKDATRSPENVFVNQDGSDRDVKNHALKEGMVLIAWTNVIVRMGPSAILHQADATAQMAGWDKCVTNLAHQGSTGRTVT